MRQSHQHNVPYDRLIDDAPEFLQSQSAREEWATLPASERVTFLRRMYEVRRGSEILKDRRCGRKKYAPNGFYSRAIAREKLDVAQRTNASAERISKLQQEVQRLDELLRRDEEILEAMDVVEMLPDDIRRGRDPAQLFKDIQRIDQLIVADAKVGMFELMLEFNVNPFALAQQVIATTQPAAEASLNA